MKHTIIVALIALLTLSAGAAPAFKKLQTIDAKEIETRPTKEIHALMKSDPKADVFVVTATVFLNENVTDYYKWFYDPTKKVLALMHRSTMKAVGEDYSWRVWHDIEPEHFKDGLPYSNRNLRTTASPYGKAVETFPVKYPATPEVTKWP